MSLKPGHFKTYSTPLDSFWCCVSTGIENHAKYADTIYARSDEALYVNLFIASEAYLEAKGTGRPAGDAIPRTRHLAADVPVQGPNATCPAGAVPFVDQGIHRVGQRQAAGLRRKGSYVTIQRTWHNGDTVDLRLPMGLHAEPLPGVPTRWR